MQAKDFLIAGLGNPGIQYCGNRHNIGFMVIDDLAGRWAKSIFQEKWQAAALSLSYSDRRIHLVKPLTFMNLSGRAVGQYYRFYKMLPDQLLVAHDDLDMHFGRIKLVRGGGAGGHNGIKSIVESLGTNDFYRLKVGIGRPGQGDVHPGVPIERYVLSDFQPSEKASMVERYPLLEKGIAFLLQGEPERAMGLLNGLK